MRGMKLVSNDIWWCHMFQCNQALTAQLLHAGMSMHVENYKHFHFVTFIPFFKCDLSLKNMYYVWFWEHQLTDISPDSWSIKASWDSSLSSETLTKLSANSSSEEKKGKMAINNYQPGHIDSFKNFNVLPQWHLALFSHNSRAAGQEFMKSITS